MTLIQTVRGPTSVVLCVQTSVCYRQSTSYDNSASISFETLRNKEQRDGFHVGLSTGYSSIGRQLTHVDDVEA
jgi:hypothetical protein